MALYDYELRIAREATATSLLSDLQRHGLLTAAPGAGEAELLGMGAFASERWTTGDVQLQVVTLLFEREDFDRLAATRFDELVDWIWRAARAVGALTIFVPGGSDAARWRAVPDDALVEDLERLAKTGVVAVAHPIVYFAERLAGGRLCADGHRVDYYKVERRPSTGCLYLFVNRDDQGAAEILEPGPLQPNLLDQFPRPPAGR